MAHFNLNYSKNKNGQQYQNYLMYLCLLFMVMVKIYSLIYSLGMSMVPLGILLQT